MIPEPLLIETLEAGAVDTLVADRAPNARWLKAFSEFADADWWLDEAAGEIWHADPEEGHISRGRLGPELLPLLESASARLTLELADPEYNYWEAAEDGSATERVEYHLALQDDLYALELAVLRVSAARGTLGRAGTPPNLAIDRNIRWRISQARAEISRLAGLRAYAIRAAYGTERGAQARAAADLEISEPTVSTILSTADKRIADLRAIATKTDEEDED